MRQGIAKSCFAMTEPAVASSDPSKLRTLIVKQDDGYVVSGRKWWCTGADHPLCSVAFVWGVTPRKGHSMILVPMNAKGVTIKRSLPVLGYEDSQLGKHLEIQFDDVWVPKENMILGEGQCGKIAEYRLGPGRVHQCMKLIGMAEKALALTIERASQRVLFGKRLLQM